jgi:hypothetical protein
MYAAESDPEGHRLFGKGALACSRRETYPPPAVTISFRNQTMWVLSIQNSTHSSSLACVPAAAWKPPLFSLPSLHTPGCALRGWTLNVVVFARDASASVLFPPRPSQCQPFYRWPKRDIREEGGSVCPLVVTIAALSVVQFAPQRAIVQQPLRQVLLSSLVAFASGIASYDDTVAPPP